MIGMTACAPRPHAHPRPFRVGSARIPCGRQNRLAPPQPRAPSAGRDHTMPPRLGRTPAAAPFTPFTAAVRVPLPAETHRPSATLQEAVDVLGPLAPAQHGPPPPLPLSQPGRAPPQARLARAQRRRGGGLQHVRRGGGGPPPLRERPEPKKIF